MINIKCAQALKTENWLTDHISAIIRIASIQITLFLNRMVVILHETLVRTNVLVMDLHHNAFWTLKINLFCHKLKELILDMGVLLIIVLNSNLNRILVNLK